MKKLETRKQAEARALELYPEIKVKGKPVLDELWNEVLDDENKGKRKAYLQCWDEMQQDKQTCGFCIEPKQQQKELLSEIIRKDEEDGVYELTKDDIEELLNESEKELLCEMMRKDEDDGLYEVNTDSAINMGRTLSIADYNPNGYSFEYWKKNAEEDYMRTPISVLKYITVLEEKLEKALK